MTIPNQEKKSISQYWESRFEPFRAMSFGHYFCVVGPLTIGIHLVRSRWEERYQVYYEWYGLWRDSLKDCFDWPIVLRGLENARGLQLWIPYKSGALEVSEMDAQAIKTQFVIEFEEPIRVDAILQFLEQQVETSHSIYEKLLRYSDICCFLSTFRRTDQASQYLQEALYKKADFVNDKGVAIHFGSFDKWLDSTRAQIRDFERLQANVARNSNEKKLKRLPRIKTVI